MNEIVVTEPIIIPVKPTNKGLIAFASCVINDSISLNSIAVYSRPDGNGYRLLYPAKTLTNGKEINIFYPINREAGRVIENVIIDKYIDLTLMFKERYKG